MNAQTLLDQTALPIFALDDQGLFTNLNLAAAQLFGREAASLLGQPFHTVLDPYSHQKAALMLEKTTLEGGVNDWELDVLPAQGLPVLVSITTSRQSAPSGQPGGLVAVGRDLTGQMELTEQLSRTNQELEGTLRQLERTHQDLKAAQSQLIQSEKMRALGQMVTSLAHEVNNPAAFVSNNLTHLSHLLPVIQRLYEVYAPLKPLASPEQLHQIEQAELLANLEYLWTDLRDLTRESQQGIQRIRDIVISLRSFARLDEGRLKLADLNEILHTTVWLVRPIAPEGVVIEEAYGSLVPILCYPGELNQVFLNLLVNAVQAIEGQGRVRLEARQEDQRTIVTIADTGRGMETATLAHLGEPFFTTKTPGSGLGLGLAISFGIVQKHGGLIGFVSSPGKGTTVTVEIPIRSLE
jgi:two-component system, NtrC family, sensor kinase